MIIILVLCYVFIFWIKPILEREIIVNEVIPNDANSIVELIQIADTHISKYSRGSSYHIGSVIMQLNLEHEGQVWITYVSERNGSVPDIYTVRFDTIENRFKEIYKPFREDKNNPGNLYFDSWNITDKEAYQIALEAFNESGEAFEFENYNILTSTVQPSWWVVFYTKENIFRVRIHGISGEVISAGD